MRNHSFKVGIAISLFVFAFYFAIYTSIGMLS